MNLIEYLKRKEIPKRRNMCIGEGVISLQDACIPLDNICAMEITLPPKLTVRFGIFCIIVGIFICRIPLQKFRFLGILLLISGIGYILLIRYLNQIRKYCLRITVNSGMQYGFENANIEFMRDLLRKIQKAIDDRHMKFYADVTYNYMENNIENVEEYFSSLIMEENNVNISGGNNIFNSGIIRDLKDNYFGDTNTSTNVNTNVQTLSDEQWRTLVQFFENRAKDLESNSEAHKSCVQMCQDAKRKEVSTLKSRIQSVERSIFKTILGESVSGVVRHLLELVLKS